MYVVFCLQLFDIRMINWLHSYLHIIDLHTVTLIDETDNGNTFSAYKRIPTFCSHVYSLFMYHPSVPPGQIPWLCHQQQIIVISLLAKVTYFIYYWPFFFFACPQMQSETQVQSVLLTNCVFFFFFCKQHLVLLKWDLRHGPLSQRCISMRIHFFFCLPPSNCRRIKMTVPVIVQKKI